jgi:amino acid permease
LPPHIETATNTQTLFNYVNVIMGSGFLTIPYACKAGGWAALGVLWVLGAIFAATGLLVLDLCKRVDARRAAGSGKGSAAAAALQPAGYEDVAEEAFGPAGRKVVGLIMYAELLGICTVYLVLEAAALAALLGQSQLGALVESFRHAMPPGGNPWVLLSSLVVIPTVLLPGAPLSCFHALPLPLRGSHAPVCFTANCLLIP